MIKGSPSWWVGLIQKCNTSNFKPYFYISYAQQEQHTKVDKGILEKDSAHCLSLRNNNINFDNTLFSEKNNEQKLISLDIWLSMIKGD